MAFNAEKLYTLCVREAVNDSISPRQFCKKEFRILPDHVLFDFYYRLYEKKRLCMLGTEVRDLPIFLRMLNMKHRRPSFLKMFQALMDHSASIVSDIINTYVQKNSTIETLRDRMQHVDVGLRLGAFFNEGGWYEMAMLVFESVGSQCKKLPADDVTVLRRMLDCYHSELCAQAYFCKFKEAQETFNVANDIVEKLRDLNVLPNLAGLYTNFSLLYFMRSEYDLAYSWTRKALKHLNEDLPPRVVVNVLRHASKACVAKRRFAQASLLIKEAVCLATHLYEDGDTHPGYADCLMDYGYYLLHSDNIQESAQVYRKALYIQRGVFDRLNVRVAVNLEDLAYSLYVNEYSSGNFCYAKESIEDSITIMEQILPKDHLILSSAIRVKALILEEMALDMYHDTQAQKQMLQESEELHQAALRLSLSAFGENNVQTAKHYGNLGRLYQSMMLYDKAEQMHLKAIDIKERLLGRDDYEVGLSIGHLASLYNYHMNRHAEAEVLYHRSIRISLRLFGDTYSGLEYDYRGLINVYTERLNLTAMLNYVQIMRNWKDRRSAQKKTECPTNPQPLPDVIKQFFDLCD